jgi:hypothetical protein
MELPKFTYKIMINCQQLFFINLYDDKMRAFYVELTS